MKKRNRPDGTIIWIIEEKEAPPADEIYFSQKEWQWIEIIAAGYDNRHDKTTLLDGCCERKKKDPNWDLFAAFPEQLLQDTIDVFGESPMPAPVKPEEKQYTIQEICKLQLNRFGKK